MKLRQVRFAARVHTFSMLASTRSRSRMLAELDSRGQTIVNGKLRHAIPVASCTRLVRPAAATSLRTQSAGIGARHAHSIEGETWDRGKAVLYHAGMRRAINEVGSHPSHAFLRRHVSAPGARAGVSRGSAGSLYAGGPHAGRGQHARRHGGGRGPRLAGLRGARGGGGRARAARVNLGRVRFSAGILHCLECKGEYIEIVVPLHVPNPRCSPISI